MLMFDNAIFASFIPQILMVIGYLSCLLAPGYFKIEQKEQPFVKQIELSQNLTSSSSSVTTYNFTQNFDQTELVINDDTHHFQTSFNVILWVPPIAFDTSKGISFQLFSRPPPSQNC